MKKQSKLGHNQIHIEFEIIKNRILIQFIMEIHISYFIDYTQQKYKNLCFYGLYSIKMLRKAGISNEPLYISYFVYKHSIFLFYFLFLYTL